MSQLTDFQNGILLILANQEHLADHSITTRKWNIPEVKLNTIYIQSVTDDVSCRLSTSAKIFNDRCLLSAKWTGDSEYTTTIYRSSQYSPSHLGDIILPIPFDVLEDITLKLTCEVRFLDTEITDIYLPTPRFGAGGKNYDTIADIFFTDFYMDGEDTVSVATPLYTFSKDTTNADIHVTLHLDHQKFVEALHSKGKKVVIKMKTEKV